MSDRQISRRRFLAMSGAAAACGFLPGAPSSPPARADAGSGPSAVAAGEAVTLDTVRAAQRRIGGTLVRTPCVRSRLLSRLTGAEVFLKLENLQATGAFKERGALNRLAQLSPAERQRGVIAASTGNHAQAVSLHAARLGIRAVIVMPGITPPNKVERTRALGAEVRIAGATFDEAAEIALALATAEGLTFVHPFNDPEVIAGQGTIAVEMLEDQPDLDALLIPVGGGGLVAGCAIAALGMRPRIAVFGVESRACAAMDQRLQAVPVAVGGPTLAEGAAGRGCRWPRAPRCASSARFRWRSSAGGSAGCWWSTRPPSSRRSPASATTPGLSRKAPARCLWRG